MSANNHYNIDPQLLHSAGQNELEIESHIYDNSAESEASIQGGPITQNAPLNTMPGLALSSTTVQPVLESAQLVSSSSTNPFNSEADLAAQETYIDNYGLAHTPGIINLAIQINEDQEQSQQGRLVAPGPAEPLSLLNYGNDNNHYDITLAADAMEIDLSPTAASIKQYPSPDNDLDTQTIQGEYGVDREAFDGHKYSAFLSDQQQLRVSASVGPELPVAPNTMGLDALIASARRDAEQQRSVTVARECSRRSASTSKVKSKRTGKRPQPTPMQCAPLSISADSNEKRLHIENGKDGTPRVILRDGEDPNQPIPLAECVARPRDEQLTKPRDGEPPIQRLRVNSRRSRPPYLPLEEGMTEEEKLRRAMRNQEISELDRLDRRTRNNESARRTRERTKKTIADQTATIEQQKIVIQNLQTKTAIQQQEIQRLRIELSNERGDQIYGGHTFAVL